MEINRTKLLDGIGRVIPAIAKRELFDQADKLAISDGFLVAYNDAVSISVRMPELEGLDGALDGRKLYDLLGKLSAEVVTISAEGEGKVLVRCGRSKVSFDVVPVSLPIGEIDRTGEESDVPDGFGEALLSVASCCARDMSRPVLTCVSFTERGMEAADGYRAARFRFDDFPVAGALLPVTAVETLSDFPVERVAVADGGEWIRFVAHDGDTTVHARLMAGKYPDLDQYYEVGGDPVVLPEVLSDVLDRAQVFSKRATKIDEEVSIQLKANQVVVEAQCDGAKFSEVVKWDGKAKASFSIHPRFLAAALKIGTTCAVGEAKVKFSGDDWEYMVALR